MLGATSNTSLNTSKLVKTPNESRPDSKKSSIKAPSSASSAKKGPQPVGHQSIKNSRVSSSKKNKELLKKSSVYTLQSDVGGGQIDPNLLSTVHNDKNKEKTQPVSRRTKQQQNAEEQEILAKQAITRTARYLERRTHFDYDQVRALIEIFRRLTSMGKMDRLRFRETLHTTLGISDDVMLDRVFFSFDGDNEGSVSETEWVIGLSVMLRGRLDEQTAFCYEVYDVNGDQSIGRDELNTCLRGCLYKIPEMDDDLDLEEGQREIVELAMRKLDVDRDGQIKYKDFYNAVQSDPLLLQCIGQCLPTDKALMTFISLFDIEFRKFSSFLSHPKDHAWERENNKFDPVVAERLRKKYFKKQRNDDGLVLHSIFHNNTAVTPPGSGVKASIWG